MRHGAGKLSYKDGGVYTGEFVDGERTGKVRAGRITGNLSPLSLDLEWSPVLCGGTDHGMCLKESANLNHV